MFDWVGFYFVAELLIDPSTLNGKSNNEVESLIRCAISRYYYYAFNMIKGKKKIQVPKEEHDSHLFVVSILKNASDPDDNCLGGYLNKLRSIRRKADYDNIFKLSIDYDYNKGLQETQRCIAKIQGIIV
jgi:hypothetical protein